MAKLIYGMLTSVDGYVADENGNFDWAEPDEETHRFVNEMERSIGTHLYGRRLYETMIFWENPPLDQAPAHIADYARIWQATDKIVYSTTLEQVASERTRIESTFDVDAVRGLKESADSDLAIGGANLAGQALAAGLVDVVNLFVCPVIVGNGTRALPDGVGAGLELIDERRFANGTVHLSYART